MGAPPQLTRAQEIVLRDASQGKPESSRQIKIKATGEFTDTLPLPEMLDGKRRVKMSPDPRQALCYQCHAPVSTMQVASGDDRTGMGVHEGISCLACHAQHGQKTRASCATCHPKMSNCGLDVETMDTTFKSADSKHNVHWVKCADCHHNESRVEQAK